MYTCRWYYNQPVLEIRRECEAFFVLFLISLWMCLYVFLSFLNKLLHILKHSTEITAFCKIILSEGKSVREETEVSTEPENTASPQERAVTSSLENRLSGSEIGVVLHLGLEIGACRMQRRGARVFPPGCYTHCGKRLTYTA